MRSSDLDSRRSSKMFVVGDARSRVGASRSASGVSQPTSRPWIFIEIQVIPKRFDGRTTKRVKPRSSDKLTLEHRCTKYVKYRLVKVRTFHAREFGEREDCASSFSYLNSEILY